VCNGSRFLPSHGRLVGNCYGNCYGRLVGNAWFSLRVDDLAYSGVSMANSLPSLFSVLINWLISYTSVIALKWASGRSRGYGVH
jgi:hypothetical protein